MQSIGLRLKKSRSTRKTREPRSPGAASALVANDSARYGFYSCEALNPDVPVPPQILLAQRWETLKKNDPDGALLQLYWEKFRSLRQAAEEDKHLFYSPSAEMH